MSKTPALLNQLYLPNETRIPDMSTVRDGQVAVAASSTRVAVAWTTGQALGQNEDVGGYAVFACTQ